MAINTSEASQSKGVRRALPYYAGFVLLGLMLASLGPTLPILAEQTNSSLSQISILFTANSLGYIGGSLLGGHFYDRFRGQPILMATLLGMALFTFMIPLLTLRWMLVLNFLLLGVIMGSLDVGGNTLIVWIYGRDVGPYMNALHLSFGVGAFLSPVLIDRIIVQTGSIRNVFWLFALLMIPVALWMISVTSPERDTDHKGPKSSTITQRHRVLIGLIAVFFFMHVGAELAFGGWIFSYAAALQIGQQTNARVLNSLYWGGLILGRLAAIPLSIRVSPSKLLTLDLLGAVLSLGVVFFLPDWSLSIWIGTIGFGFFIASMFASSINFAEKRMPISSAVTSIFLVGANGGAMILPWIIGQMFETIGPESMIIVVGSAVLVASGLLAIIYVYGKRLAIDET